MNGYIYTMYAGADPGAGWEMSDPMFGPIPTLGACVPHIRRAVQIGDYIFVVSGRVDGERQFVVGGFSVAEKINGLTAYRRFPANRLHLNDKGQVVGNVITDSKGHQHQLDNHNNFERRLENYIVGRDPVVLESPNQFAAARDETLTTLQDIFKRRGRRVFDVIGRHRKMTESQVQQMILWLREIKGEHV